MINKDSKFLAILTAVGEAKLANAIGLGLPWLLTEMGVGDANDTDPIPDRMQTALIHEQRRAPLNQLRDDEANPGLLIAEQIIPADVGGWWVREVGLYDVDGDLVAVANCAPSYKSLLSQGSGRTQVIRMTFIVSNTANVVLKIDPAVVLATREYVDSAFLAHLATEDPLVAGKATVGAAKKMAREDHRHPTDTSRAPLASPAFTGTPTAPVTARFETSEQLMSAAAVQQRGQQFANVTPFTDALIGAIEHVGGVVHCVGAASNSYSLPDSEANKIPPGAVVRVQNWGVTNLALNVQANDKMQESIDGSWTAITRLIPPDTHVDCLYVGTGYWLLTGPGTVGKTRSFACLLAPEGYQRLPSGLIIQWMTAAFSGPLMEVAFNLPIAFPSMNFGCTVSMTNSAIYAPGGSPFVAGMAHGPGQVLLQSNYTASQSAARVLAFGI